jgi:hypothetical protein
LPKEAEIELSRYSIILPFHLDWKTRDQSLKLLKEFVEGNMTVPDFWIAFSNRVYLTNDGADILKSNLIFLLPNEKSMEFGDFLETIYDDCDS